jgi:aminopeptidase N
MDGGWVLHEPSYQGEYLVYDASDFDVTLHFADPAAAPVVASSGLLEAGADGTALHYTLTSGRAFVLSLSREFQVLQMQAENATVFVYYYSGFELPARNTLKTVAASVEIFSKKYGAYAHKSMSVVLADFPGSMEYSAFFFYGRGPEHLFDGTPNNEFTSIAAHETAHQWWFDQVASDQALNPWMDEALATYSEPVYYETVSPESINKWWWPYRVDKFGPEGFVDSSIYDLYAYRPYVNSVYLNGAHFLDDVRHRIGSENFFAFLQDYYTMYQGKIATPEDFFALLGRHANGADFSDLLLKYFQNSY